MRKTPNTAFFVANRGFALSNSRMLLMEHLLAGGWKVGAVVGPCRNTEQIKNAGVEIIEVRFSRKELAPLKDLKAFWSLRKLYSQRHPALVHHFNVKPIILGTFAARALPQTTVLNTVTGLGQTFVSGRRNRLLASLGFRAIKRRSAATIIQNPDDRDILLRRGLVDAGGARVITSSGVDTARFRPDYGRRAEEPDTFVLMVARLLWPKGVREYVEAAETCKRRYPNIRFLLAGEIDTAHRLAVDMGWLHEHAEKGTIEYIGFINRLEDLLPRVSLFVFPSYYREGVPRVSLEAAACGAAIVTTDSPGCRETVIHGKTGTLVPPRDSDALAEAILRLLSQPALLYSMGRAGRELVERDFDLRVITERYLEVYRSCGIDV